MVKPRIDRDGMLFPRWANRQQLFDSYRMPDRVRRLTAAVVAFVLLVDFTVTRGADWPMRGGNRNRNAVVPDVKGPTEWNLAEGQRPAKNIRWSAELGYVSCGDPVIAGGLVWVGTNNGLSKEDASVLMCFRERDGQLLYKYVSPRLVGEGHLNSDWPGTSLASSPLVEGNRLWFCTNRCEVICLEIAPLRSGTGEPRVVWKVDMRSQLGVFPVGVHLGSHASHCSIAAYKDLIYVNTTNAARYDKIPAPDAPSLVCFQKQNGQVRWQDKSPGKNILNAQLGSPLVIEAMGQAQVVMGQGDGWVRGFDALTGEMLWKFDINRKSSKTGFLAGNRGDHRSDLVAMPVFHDNRVYFAVGRNYESCFGQGKVCCLDPTKRGDISSELNDGPDHGRPNPNSGLVWEYLGEGDAEETRMNRTLASVVIHKNLVIATDQSGIAHCLDVRNGKKLWTHDAKAAIIGSPLIVGDTIYVSTDEGVVVLLELSRQKRLIAERELDQSIESGPAFANGVLYLMNRNSLFAISESPN